MNRRGRKKAHLRANYSIANYLKTDSKAMVTRILDTLIENAVNHSKIVATEIIDDILKGAVKFSHRQNFCHLERKISMAM